MSRPGIPLAKPPLRSTWLLAPMLLALGGPMLRAQVPRPAQSPGPKLQAPPAEPPERVRRVAAPLRESAPSYGLGLPAVAPPIVQLPAPPVEKMANGVTLVLVRNAKLPIVDVAIDFTNGYADDPAGQRGLNRAVAQGMRFGGTVKRSEREVEDFLRVRNIGLLVNVGAHLTEWSLRCRKEDLADSLELMAELIREPGFRRGAIEEFQQQMRQAIRSRGQVLEATAVQEIEASWFGATSPLTRRNDYTDLRAMDRETIVARFAASVGPSRAVIGLSGDIDEEAARQLVAKSFGSWQGKAEPRTPAARLTPPEKKLIALDKPNSSAATVVVGLPLKQWSQQRTAAEAAALGLWLAQLDSGKNSELEKTLAPFRDLEGETRITWGQRLDEVPMPGFPCTFARVRPLTGRWRCGSCCSE